MTIFWICFILYFIAGFIYAAHWADDDGKLQGPEDLVALVIVMIFWPLFGLGEFIDRCG